MFFCVRKGKTKPGGENRRVKQLERTAANSAGQVWRERSMDGGTASHLGGTAGQPIPALAERAST